MPDWMYWAVGVGGLAIDAVATAAYFRTKSVGYLVAGAPFAAVGVVGIWFAVR
jgi:hypothetical protein